MAPGQRSDDNLLPTKVPRRLGVVSLAAVTVLLLGMILAGAEGGVNWLIGVGSAGTALGTLGLAYFTFTVAERTTELADVSLRELSASNRQADAAAVTAREAEMGRLDVLAPILDFAAEVWWPAVGRQRGVVNPEATGFSPGDDVVGNLEAVEFEVGLRLTFTNFGRTPAFASMRYVGAAFDGQGEMIRVNPGAARSFRAYIYYSSPVEDPTAPREIRYEIEVQGALTRGTFDIISWTGEVTLLQPAPPGWRVRTDALRLKEYNISRSHGLYQ